MEKLTFGNRSFYSLYNLLVDDDWLETLERELARRAQYDLENAAVTLKHTGDTQSAIVQAHEAAEKYLKAALHRAGNTKKLKSFGHYIQSSFQSWFKQKDAILVSRCQLPIFRGSRQTWNYDVPVFQGLWRWRLRRTTAHSS